MQYQMYIYTKSYFLKVIQIGKFVLHCERTTYSFFLSLYKASSKGLRALWPHTLISLILATLGWGLSADVNRAEGLACLQPQRCPFSSALGFVPCCPWSCGWGSSPTVQRRALPSIFSGSYFPLHVFASINAKYWKVPIDFPSTNMKGLFFRLQYFLRKYLWSICVRIKEKIQTPPLIVSNSEQPVYLLGFFPTENVNNWNYHHYAVCSIIQSI